MLFNLPPKYTGTIFDLSLNYLWDLSCPLWDGECSLVDAPQRKKEHHSSSDWLGQETSSQHLGQCEQYLAPRVPPNELSFI